MIIHKYVIFEGMDAAAHTIHPPKVFEKPIKQCGQAKGRDPGRDGGDSDSMCPQGALQKL